MKIVRKSELYDRAVITYIESKTNNKTKPNFQA